jgi:hypothetical protein
LLAKNLPLQLLLKHSDNLLQLEALLYGCAGLLSKHYNHNYPRQLQNEFEFLKGKYKQRELDGSTWKFSRMRPANFPSVRLWQFAMVLHKCPELFSCPEQFNSLEKLQEAISFPHEGYWRDHYKFDGREVKAIKGLGKSSAENILINTIAPFLFFFGKQTGKEKFTEAAIECFETFDFEHNHKTRHFTKAGLKFKNSGKSQGLIHLFDNYCKTKSCLKCGIASCILTKYE